MLKSFVSTFKAVRSSISRGLDFVSDHILYPGKRFALRVVLAILVIAIIVATLLALWASYVALSLLFLPLMTYLGWNWCIPQLFGAARISFVTAIGINIMTALELFLLRQIVIRIKN